MPTMPDFPDLNPFTINPREELYAGLHMGEWAPCWSPPRDAAAVIGPPGTGKTSGVFIPQMLWWSGAAICTSTRGDILQATGDHRARLAAPHGGRVFVFDPFHSEPGVTSMSWSPLDGCRDADLTYRRVSEMTATVAAGIQDAQHWARGAARILRPLMHAAAINQQPLETVLAWIDDQAIEAPAAILEESGDTGRAWAGQLRSVEKLSDRERGSFYSVAADCFDVYAAPAAAATATGGFDIDHFLTSCSTLYVIGPPHYQAATAPIVVALISAILQRAWELAAAAGGVLAPRLLACLDELPNIAPLPVATIMGLVSAGGGSGITTSWGSQTLAHMRDRYGDHATDAILGASGSKLIFGGLSPGSDLADISSWAGEHRETQVTIQTGGAQGDAGGGMLGVGNRSDTNRAQSITHMYRPILPPETIRQTAPGHAWLWMGPEPPILVETRPSHLVPAYAAAAGYTPEDPPP